MYRVYITTSIHPAHGFVYEYFLGKQMIPDKSLNVQLYKPKNLYIQACIFTLKTHKCNTYAVVVFQINHQPILFDNLLLNT